MIPFNEISVLYSLIRLEGFFSNLTPGSIELIKVILTPTVWIGSLTLFMWVREKRKRPAVA